MREFDFLEPSSVQEASQLLAQYGDDARVIAGGTALMLGMRQRMLAFQARRLGVANPAAGENGREKMEPERGDALNLALWRIGANSSMVWEVAVTPPSGLFVGVAEYGLKESIAIGAMHWSPDGLHGLRARILTQQASA